MAMATTVIDPTTIQASPHALALKTFIDASVQRLENGSQNETGGNPDNQLLFLGNPHIALPSLTLDDPTLNNDERICLMQVFKFAREAGTGTAFPSYTWLKKKLGIRSDTTIASILSVLRIVRWTTLCRRVRAGDGRFRGNVYAAHDQPMDLSDTLYLDPDYMAFLSQATDHSNPRVQKIARAVLGTIQDDLDSNIDVTEPTNPLERQAAASEVLLSIDSNTDTESRENARFFSFNAHRLHIMEMAGNAVNPPPPKYGDGEPPLHILEPDRLQNMEPPPLVSSLVKKQTNKQSEEGGLEFGYELPGNTKKLIRMKLSNIPEEHRQPLLNELLGRMKSQQGTAQAVRKPIKYLDRLIKLLKDDGDPFTDLSLGPDHWHTAPALSSASDEEKISHRIKLQNQKNRIRSLQQLRDGAPEGTREALDQQVETAEAEYRSLLAESGTATGASHA